MANKKQGRCGNKQLFCKLFSESTSITGLAKKLEYKCKGNAVPGGVSKIIRQKIEEYGLDITRLKGQGWNKGLTKHNSSGLRTMALKNSLTWADCFRDGSNVKNQALLKKLVESGKRIYHCEKCGLSEWQGEEIVLELHHVNGKFNDNREENLRILCPNCHSLLKKGKYSLNGSKEKT